MRGIDFGIDDIAVDEDGTIWLFDHVRQEFRYVTEDGLSYDGYHYPLDTAEPYVLLDAPAAAMVRVAIRSKVGK